ncbi:MAG: universal stress protein [Deltaproteobacteria bacterium]|nr:universal stress protein [Deltaproteobacteria bacterium]
MTDRLRIKRKVLVVIDGTPISDKAAKEAVDLAWGSDPSKPGELVSLFITQPLSNEKPFYLEIPKKSEKEKWEKFLDDIFFVVEKEAKAENLHVTRVIEDGNPVEAILKVANEEMVDVIVMGSSERSLMRRALIGNPAHKVLNHAKCSVYIVKG